MRCLVSGGESITCDRDDFGRRVVMTGSNNIIDSTPARGVAPEWTVAARNARGCFIFFVFSSRRRHTRWNCDWSSDVCSSDLLTEALATELGLTAERLLGDHRVRAGRARVDLVVDQVVELQDVHVAHGDRVRERLAGATVEEPRLSVRADQADAVAARERRAEEADDLALAS